MVAKDDRKFWINEKSWWNGRGELIWPWSFHIKSWILGGRADNSDSIAPTLSIPLPVTKTQVSLPLFLWRTVAKHGRTYWVQKRYGIGSAGDNWWYNDLFTTSPKFLLLRRHVESNWSKSQFLSRSFCQLQVSLQLLPEDGGVRWSQRFEENNGEGAGVVWYHRDVLATTPTQRGRSRGKF